MRRSESQRMKFILNWFYGFGFGFCSVPFSGLFLIRRIGRGQENWMLKEMCCRQQPAVTALSLNLLQSPLTSQGRFLSREPLRTPSGSVRTQRDPFVKNNQRPSSVQNSCNSLWGTPQTSKPIQLKPTILSPTICELSSGYGWVGVVAMPYVHSDL